LKPEQSHLMLINPLRLLTFEIARCPMSKSQHPLLLLLVFLLLLVWLLLLFLLFYFTGCIKESTEGDSIHITYELWVWFSLFFGGIAVSVAGWFLRGFSECLGWFMMLGGASGALFFGPSTFLENAKLTPSKFNLNFGFYATTHFEVKLDEIFSATVNMEETSGKRGRTNKHYYFVCVEKNGKLTKLPLSNAICEKAIPHLAARIRGRGINIIDRTGR
jgi:hypothetical protein